LSCRISHGQWQGDANALSAFHHVRIRHDVSIRIDDHARPHSMLPNDKGGLRFVLLAKRAISGDEDLHDGGRNLRRQLLQRINSPLQERRGA